MKWQAHSDWKDTIDRLLQCKHQGFLRKGEGLQRKWNNSAYKHLDDMHWALQKRKRSAKLQSITVTGLADASVNDRMKRMLQEELELEPYHRKRPATETETARKTKDRKTAPNQDSKTSMHRAHMASRARRYQLLDNNLFWWLRSGRAVETVLHNASLQSGATTRTTKALFEDDEWNEILAKTPFDLPQLPRPTLLFLNKLRRSILEGKHPNYVMLPDSATSDPKDLADCILAQKTAAEWHFLYHKEPSPFVVDDLSESWWARKSWAALHDLLNDVPSIFMVDGEKRGLDSSRKRNMGRHLNPEEPVRKRCGRKLDLICRDEELLHDWMVVERMRHWDPQSTKLSKEFGCDVLRETITIAHNRMFEVSPLFRHSCIFFGGYTSATESSYVLLMEPKKLYTLPRTKNDLQEPFKGLAKLLRIWTALKSTIEMYQELRRSPHLSETVASQDEEAEEEDLSWMIENPVGLFDPNIVVVSSPLGPDDLVPGVDDHGSQDESDYDH
ncbi:hypothetical protein BG000_010545 [Podila horticola]|nr:hypothetical protein BG000_010545 [Podila horticola]